MDAPKTETKEGKILDGNVKDDVPKSNKEEITWEEMNRRRAVHEDRERFEKGELSDDEDDEDDVPKSNKKEITWEEMKRRRAVLEDRERFEKGELSGDEEGGCRQYRSDFE